MRKWQILAIVGFTFGIIGSGWAIAEQQRAASQVYELRIYKTTPGNREALANRFGDHTAAMFERAGMTNVGYWNAATGDDVEDTFIYMLAYPSREAATRCGRSSAPSRTSRRSSSRSSGMRTASWSTASTRGSWSRHRTPRLR